jgi:type II secretory pathway pseudopilin PulG
MEIVVAIAVLLVLAAAIAPSLIGGLDRGRASGAVETLQDLTDAMSEMRRDNQDWPGRLSHMTRPITSSDLNVCSNTYSPGKVGNWDGPYFDRVVPSTGLPIEIGVIKDDIYRSAVSGNDAYLTLEISAVSEGDALEVNRIVDNDGDVSGRTTGTVQWSAVTSEGLVTMYYYRPIRGC